MAYFFKSCTAFAEDTGKLRKTRAGTDGPKFHLIPGGKHESNILKDRHQGTLERRLLGLLGGVSQESDKVI